MARPSLDKNVKFKRLVRKLGVSRALVRGHLELMWDVGNECGDPLLGDSEGVEAAAEWEGEPGILFDALKEGGWIDETESGWEIHDFFVNAPDYVTGRRAREMERNKRKVCQSCSSEYHSSDRRSMYCSQACKQFAYRTRSSESQQTVTERYRTLPNETEGSVTVTDRYGTPAPAPAPAPGKEQEGGSFANAQSPPLSSDENPTTHESPNGDHPALFEGAPPIRKGPPPCPHEKIIEAYHEILPELPRVQAWSEHRRVALQSRWRESKERQSLSWWEDFFTGVRDQPLLMGERGDFRANLPWLIGPKNFLKALEGNFIDPKRAQQRKAEESLAKINNPHWRGRHGYVHSDGSFWCSRRGEWVAIEEFQPLTKEEETTWQYGPV